MNPATAQRRARRLSFLTAVALAATAFFVPASAAAAPPANAGFRDGRYIVTFVDAPVAEYDGYVDGYAATAPRAGRKLNAHSNAARPVVEPADPDPRPRRWPGSAREDLRLHDHQQRRRRAADRGAGGRRWPSMPGVVACRKDELAKPDTTALAALPRASTPAGGLWSQLGGARRPAPASSSASSTPASGRRAAFAGETGIPVPADWHGTWSAGEQFTEEPVQRQARSAPATTSRASARTTSPPRLPVPARRRRARVAHVLDGRRQQRHDGHHRRQR